MFEELRQRTGARYVSDLRRPPYREKAIAMLAQNTRGGGYSLHEWNDALEYLLLHEACSSIEEAKQVFIGASKRLRAERLSFGAAMRKEDGVSEAEAKPRGE